MPTPPPVTRSSAWWNTHLHQRSKIRMQHLQKVSIGLCCELAVNCCFLCSTCDMATWFSLWGCFIRHLWYSMRGCQLFKRKKQTFPGISTSPDFNLMSYLESNQYVWKSLQVRDMPPFPCSTLSHQQYEWLLRQELVSTHTFPACAGLGLMYILIHTVKLVKCNLIQEQTRQKKKPCPINSLHEQLHNIGAHFLKNSLF